MIPYYLQGRMGSAKDQDSRIRQHDTDIERLWQAIAQVTKDGLILGNDPAADIYPPNGWGSGSGSGVNIREGVTTSTLSAPSSGKTDITTCTVEEWDADATLAVTMPAMITTNTGITITNRDKNLSLVTGTYVQWFEKTLADGSTENRLCYWSCP